MKRYLLLIVMAMTAVVCAVSAPKTQGDEPIDARWLKANYTKSEYMIPMRDGVKLYTAVYTPKDKREKHPILMQRTPYSHSPYGKKNSNIWRNKANENYLRAGYILVFQDSRGRWMSEGDFINVPPYIANKAGTKAIDEASDTYDTVEWLLRKVKNHNGRVGVYGNSYCGYYSLMAAASGHPAIVAVSPQAPMVDWWMGDDIHHNGALAMLDIVSFLPVLGTTARKGPSAESEPFDPPLIEGEIGEFFMQNTLADITRKVNGRVPLWEDIISHPDYDAWWQARDARQALKRISSAMLLVGGTFDAEDPYGVWESYRTLKEYNPSLDCRIVVGPWTHGAWRGNGDANKLGEVEFSEESLSQFYRDEVEFPFFEQYLRGVGDGGASAVGALVFFTGENCWREMEAWTPEKGKEQRLYLGEEGSLLTTAPEVKDSYTSYTSDPQNPVPYYPDITTRRKSDYLIRSQEFVEEREDVLTFLSPVLSEDMIVAGKLTAEIYAAISTTDADFVVKVIDVGPNGETEMMVRANIMRGRYRNSFSEPEAFTPDKVERVEFDLTDIAHTFQAGHRIKVQVQSSWFPIFDRNPQQFIDIYKAEKEDFIPSHIKIYHDAGHPSAIRFNVM